MTGQRTAVTGGTSRAPRAPRRTLLLDEGAPGAHSGGNILWLISFTDIMALMLTFFVLIFSISEPDNTRWKDIKTAMYDEFGEIQGPTLESGPHMAGEQARALRELAQDLNYLHALFAHQIEQSGMEGIALTLTEDGLLLTLPEHLLFDSGASTLTEAGKQGLFILSGSILPTLKNRIEIYGHTDPAPVSAEKTPHHSNWDLSLARAASVAAELYRNGYGQAAGLAGLADSQFYKTPELSDTEERYKLARRVEILIRKEKPVTLWWP